MTVVLFLSLVLCVAAEELALEKREDMALEKGEDWAGYKRADWLGYKGDSTEHFRNLTTGEQKTEQQIQKEHTGMRNLMKNNKHHVYATCTLVLFADLVDFDTADARCKNFSLGTYHRSYGHLATIDNAEKNLQIQLLIRLAYPENMRVWAREQWAWVGLKKIRNIHKKPLQSDYNPEDWAWYDGNTLATYNFSSWMYRMPDQKYFRKGRKGCQEEEGCYQNQMVVNKAGKWDDAVKYHVHPYACDYQGRYILSEDPSHWSDAKRKCEEAGLVLAKVHSQEELNEMMVAAEYFLGPRVDDIWDNTNWFWLGGNDINEEGKWTWNDGEPFPTDWALPWMHPWRSPNPDNAEFRGDGTQNVLAMSKWGQWDDSFGEERKRSFACMCPDVTGEDSWRTG